MKHKQIIGVTGCARTGKDLFCNIAGSILTHKGFRVRKFALAHALKKDCQQFLNTKCGLNVWTNDTIEKSKLRPILIAYGDIKRHDSDGTYFTSILQPLIERCDADFTFISDVRYAQYDKDEHYWLKNIMNGKLIHLSQYSIGSTHLDKLYTQPANYNETMNDPKMRALADICVEWSRTTQNELTNIVNETLKSLKIIE